MIRHALMLVLFLLLNNVAHALTVTSTPSFCQSVSGGGLAWSNAGNAQASDNSRATAAALINVGGNTDYLQCTGFNFAALPANSTINGITVNVERKYGPLLAVGDFRDAAVRLVKGGAIGAEDRATSTLYTKTDFTEAHGGATDLWGGTWTPAGIKAAGFGAAFAAAFPLLGVATTVSVDAISVTVDYSPLLPPTLSKMASTSSAVAGGLMVFTIKATNPNPVALTDIVVTDALPSGMSYAAGAMTLGSTAVSGQTVTWTLPELPADGSATLSLAVKLDKQGVLTNTITSPGATSASARVLVLAQAVTHYRMDEPAGTWTGATGEIIDSGGTQLHGKRMATSTPTVTNAVSPDPTIVSQVPSVSGSFCNAGKFDGKGVMVTPSSEKFQYTTQLSATAWVYPTSYPTDSGSGVNKDDLSSILSNDTNYEFHLNPQGQLYWWWKKSTLTSDATIPLDTWTHIAITFDSSDAGGRQRIYINGVEDENTNNWKGTLPENKCPFYIGGDISTDGKCTLRPGRNFRGMIDEAKLYNYELSADEVQADMTLGRMCSGAFDHVRIEHTGAGSICSPETVTVKACLDAACSTLYPGDVTVRLSPSGWVGGDTFTFSNGVATRQLSINTEGDVTLGTASVSPAPANNPRCFKGGTETCTLNFAKASCAFDIVEKGAAPLTRLYTKRAGVSFQLDVLALKGDKTVNTGYVGTVNVDLADTSASGCPQSGSVVAAAGTISFDKTKDFGRKTVTFTSAKAAGNVKGRAMVGSSAACSSDNFAIRPTGFTTVSSSDATADGTGTSTTATPKIQAGSHFNLTAATGVAGYHGTPKIDNTKIVAHSGGVRNGTVSGAFGAANAATGQAAGNAFAYDDVGYFKFDPQGVYDDGFTAVDSAMGDCTNDFSNSLAGGKYGCKFGNTSAAGYFGRFIPDHFAVSGAAFANRSAIVGGGGSTFTYMGEPMKAAFTLTAQNASGGTTQNYNGDFAKLAVTTPAAFAFGAINAATVLSGRLGTACAPCNAWSKGVATPGVTLTFSRGAAPDGPYDNLDIGIAPIDSDGVALKSSALDLNLDAAAGNDHQLIGSTKVRFGVLRLGNAYGTEVLPLRVPLEAQYWNGAAFQTNYDDSHTPLAAGNFSLSNFQKNLQNGETALGGAGTLSQGRRNLSLSAPGAGNNGSVDICLDLGPDPAGYSCAAVGANLPYLQGAWGGAAYSFDPKSRATFGVYKRSNEMIYLRENY